MAQTTVILLVGRRVLVVDNHISGGLGIVLVLSACCMFYAIWKIRSEVGHAGLRCTLTVVCILSCWFGQLMLL